MPASRTRKARQATAPDATAPKGTYVADAEAIQPLVTQATAVLKAGWASLTEAKKEVALILLRIRSHIMRDGLPDVQGQSNEYREAQRTVIADAGVEESERSRVSASLRYWTDELMGEVFDKNTRSKFSREKTRRAKRQAERAAQNKASKAKVKEDSEGVVITLPASPKPSDAVELAEAVVRTATLLAARIVDSEESIPAPARVARLTRQADNLLHGVISALEQGKKAATA